ncbi:hypothetical protein [Rhizobium sp. Root483D2]|uniref:hypothetical protein n=1 Tax=Rhizobium sp. Root483D2 TaxID=1736545 RepID=UPI00071623A7|nr:hypothetical protein [Rhizobium sp. Root483D2]KQY31807.1 hypothetical protein ASD32_04230 [Rhizobium sp. Root483D2]
MAFDALNILASFPGWATDFDLMYRQEQSRTAGGKTYVKDMGSPLWAGSWISKTFSPNVLDAWRARLKALENGMVEFRAIPTSRYYPIAYPNGSWPTGSAFSGLGTVGTVNANRKAVSAAGFPVGYHHSVGDYFQVGSGDLHQILEDATTGQFEIRPHLWPGVAAGAALKVLKPYCLMTIVPNSISSQSDPNTGRGKISFQAVESRS